MDSAEWIAEVEASTEYKRERFRQSMRARYERSQWRKYIINDLKERRKNNFRCRAQLTYKAYAKWSFER